MIRVLWILLFVASSVLWARDIDESASSSTEDVSSSSGPQELDVQISKNGLRTYRSEPQVRQPRRICSQIRVGEFLALCGML